MNRGKQAVPRKDNLSPRHSVTGALVQSGVRRSGKEAFVESISSGNFHNQAAKGAESAFSCMMARSAAYQRREVTWDELMKSTEVWDPKIDLSKLA
jgi:hypothetical protein